MKTFPRFILAACMATAVDAGAAAYQAADAKFREADMVFVIVGNEFFSQPAERRNRQFASLRACAKAANLAGDVVVVTNMRGKIQYFADARYTQFLKPLEWRWVKERATKQLTCG